MSYTYDRRTASGTKASWDEPDYYYQSDLEPPDPDDVYEKKKAESFIAEGLREETSKALHEAFKEWLTSLGLGSVRVPQFDLSVKANVSLDAEWEWTKGGTTDMRDRRHKRHEGQYIVPIDATLSISFEIPPALLQDFGKRGRGKPLDDLAAKTIRDFFLEANWIDYYTFINEDDIYGLTLPQEFEPDLPDTLSVKVHRNKCNVTVVCKTKGYAAWEHHYDFGGDDRYDPYY